jgi:hypothetical protein
MAKCVAEKQRVENVAEFVRVTCFVLRLRTVKTNQGNKRQR